MGSLSMETLEETCLWCPEAGMGEALTSSEYHYLILKKEKKKDSCHSSFPNQSRLGVLSECLLTLIQISHAVF